MTPSTQELRDRLHAATRARARATVERKRLAERPVPAGMGGLDSAYQPVALPDEVTRELRAAQAREERLREVEAEARGRLIRRIAGLR